MIDEQRLQEIFDAHLDKRLTTKRAQRIQEEILVLAGNRKRLRNKGTRTSTVAVPSPDGSVTARQVKPNAHDNAARSDTIVIGHPNADEE